MSRKQRIILCMLLGGGARYAVPRFQAQHVLSMSSACILGVTRIGFLHNLHALDITCKKAFSITNIILAFAKAPMMFLDVFT